MNFNINILPGWLSTGMKNTMQDKEYHAEGDVYTHSLMVIDEVKKYTVLSEKEMNILLYSALFHDLGKVKTTKIEDNGRITSKGHSRLSYHLAMEILENIDMSFEDKLQILHLVKYHGNPYHVFSRDNLEKEVISLSMDCNLRLLYHLALADFMGRKCADLDENIVMLEIFKEGAERLNCYDNAFEFKSDIAKFNYLVKGTHHYSDEPFDDTGSVVYMMSGLPGTGKDTYIRNNFTERYTTETLPIISLDEIRKELKIKPTDEQGLVVNTAKERAKVLLRKKLPFVWNATNTVKTTRDSLIDFV